MSNSFSQESIQSNEMNSNVNEETLFKNKLLVQTLEKNEQKNANFDDNRRKLREEHNEVLAKKKIVEEKLGNEEKQLDQIEKSKLY